MTSLALSTDFIASAGCPEEDLKRIAAAGFSHVHWCHHWNTNFEYCDAEVREIRRWLDEFGLSLLDLHSTGTGEKHIWSTRESERLGGLRLLENRVAMTARLGGDAVVLHGPLDPTPEQWDCLCRSLDELRGFAMRQNIRIAIENMIEVRAMPMIRNILSRYDNDYLGLCYDSGHGNLGAPGAGLDFLESVKERLAVLHLHDNDGTADQHRLPFTGTVDWPRLTAILAAAAYPKCICMEVNLKSFEPGDEGLHKAYAAGLRLSEMVAACA